MTVRTNASNLAERFWAKVQKAGPDECWPWIGHRSPQGYGRMVIGRRRRVATRISLYLDGRPAPANLQACHRCDNPPCVNPAHLFAGTTSENARDAVAKGRIVRGPHLEELRRTYRGDRHWTRRMPERMRTGTSHHAAKLDPSKVQTIRAEHAAGRSSLRALAARFGVSKHTVMLIVNRRTWKGVASV